MCDITGDTLCNAGAHSFVKADQEWRIVIRNAYRVDIAKGTPALLVAGDDSDDKDSTRRDTWAPHEGVTDPQKRLCAGHPGNSWWTCQLCRWSPEHPHAVAWKPHQSGRERPPSQSWSLQCAIVSTVAIMHAILSQDCITPHLTQWGKQPLWTLMPMYTMHKSLDDDVACSFPLLTTSSHLWRPTHIMLQQCIYARKALCIDRWQVPWGRL